MPLLILAAVFLTLTASAAYLLLRSRKEEPQMPADTAPLPPFPPALQSADPEETIPLQSNDVSDVFESVPVSGPIVFPVLPSQPAPAPTGALPILALYAEIGARRGVDPSLLRAICIHESAENPNAENPADPSVGLGQVLCKFDKADPSRVCRNVLNVEGWQGMTWERLKNPATNLDIAAQILAWNLQQYGFPRGVAIYNMWDARHSPVQGPFPNQSYVDSVLKILQRLKG